MKSQAHNNKLRISHICDIRYDIIRMISYTYHTYDIITNIIPYVISQICDIKETWYSDIYI